MTAPTPAIPTFTDGVALHANPLNALASNLTNLYNFTLGGFYNAPPLCIASQTTAQNIVNATYTPMTFQSTVVNTGNMWVASQPTQITVQVAGVYLIAAQIAYNGVSASNQREVNICVNGTTPSSNGISRNDISGSVLAIVGASTTAFYRLSAGATIYNVGWQNSGSTIPTGGAVNLLTTSLSALWVSP